MSIIKKKDTSKYFSERRHKGLHLVQLSAKSSAPELPVIELPMDGSVAVFVDDFSLEHSTPGGTISAVVMVTSCDDSPIPDSPVTPES